VADGKVSSAVLCMRNLERQWRMRAGLREPASGCRSACSLRRCNLQVTREILHDPRIGTSRASNPRTPFIGQESLSEQLPTQTGKFRPTRAQWFARTSSRASATSLSVDLDALVWSWCGARTRLDLELSCF